MLYISVLVFLLVSSQEKLKLHVEVLLFKKICLVSEITDFGETLPFYDEFFTKKC